MKIVIVTSERTGLPARCAAAVKDAAGVELVGVIYAREALLAGGGRRLRQKLRKAAKIGILGTLNGIRMRSWFRDMAQPSLVEICAAAGVPLVEVDRLNTPETAKLLRRCGADLAISAGTVFIGTAVRTAPRFGFINVHLDKLPEHRNGKSVLWSIYNLDPTTGISIHEVTSTIDGGAILYRETLPISFQPTVRTTVMATMKAIYDAVGPAVRHVCENYAELEQQAQPQFGGAFYTTPTIRQALTIWQNHQRMCAERKVPL